MTRFVAVPPGRALALGENLSLTLTPVGHLLGACAVTLRSGQASLVFSGDLGRADDLLMPAPATVDEAQVLLIESTYGNRLHPKEDVMARLGEIVRDTAERGGKVLLPTFAVGRAQALLLVLQRLRQRGEIPEHLPIFLDSPMASEATELYRRHRKLLRPPVRELENLLDGVRVIGDATQSARLARSRFPSIILSASGMATGGRVLFHLAALAPEAQHHIVFPGFQVGGSRGAKLVAGATEVKIHGEFVPVRAQVSHLEGFSGHADADSLVAWARAMRRAPDHTFVVHGEPEAADTLRSRLKDELGWRVQVPAHGASVVL